MGQVPRVRERQSGAPSVVETEMVEATARRPPGNPDAEPDAFLCSATGVSISVSSEGTIEWLGPNGVKGRIALPSGFEDAKLGTVLKVWCGAEGGDILLLYFSDFFSDKGDFVGGAALRVKLASSTVLWVAATAGNVGQPLRHGGFLYVTGLGFVGKLGLDSGKYLWHHSGLYRPPGLYVSFGKPLREAERVIFPSVSVLPLGRGERKLESALVVDDASGLIVSGAPPKVPPGGHP
jgi:hypothetical protein